MKNAITKGISVSSTHKTGSLPDSITPEQITAVLGFAPEVGDPEKVTMEWEFTYNGKPCSIWDYKGVRWSTFGDKSVFDELFGKVEQ